MSAKKEFFEGDFANVDGHIVCVLNRLSEDNDEYIAMDYSHDGLVRTHHKDDVMEMTEQQAKIIDVMLRWQWEQLNPPIIV